MNGNEQYFYVQMRLNDIYSTCMSASDIKVCKQQRMMLQYVHFQYLMINDLEMTKK